MKKLIFGLLLLFTVATKVSAQEGDVQVVKYWYYPAQNIYYNDASGDYWYFSVPTHTWTTVKVLPSTYVISDQDEKYAVYYKGPDVWKENTAHKTKYKVKGNKTKKTAQY